MSELGDLYSAWREEKQAKKQSNLERSTKILKDNNIQYQSFNGGIHLKVRGEYDFWPSTGKIMRYGKPKGRGIFKLLELLEQ